jgi:hypothetical protein
MIPNFKDWERFEKEFDAFTGKVQTKILQVHGDSVVELQQTIVERTPKDTHKAAANWQIKRGTPATQMILVGVQKNPKCDYNDYRGQVPLTLAEGILEVSKLKLDDTVYLTNLVPYVVYLEYGTASYGFSPQAPAGMARITIASWDRIVERNIKRIRKIG